MIIIMMLIVIAILMVYLRRWRYEKIINQKNSEICKKRAEMVREARKSVEELKEVTKVELETFMKSEEPPIPAYELKMIIEDTQNSFLEEIAVLKKCKIPAQEKKLREDISSIGDFTQEIIGIISNMNKNNGNMPREYKSMVRRLQRRMQGYSIYLNAILDTINSNENPLAFFNQTVNCKEIISCFGYATGLELFKEVMLTRITDKDLLSRAKDLIANAETNREEISNLIRAKNQLEIERTELNAFLESKSVNLSAFFGR